MPLLLPEPEQQFCDADGHPYAGGSIAVFVPGTDTPKDTWQDLAGSVLNTNPIILDAAGRAIIWGDGDYRLVLKDADGNLIYDQVTSAHVADVLTTDDVQALIDVETARAEAAEADLHNQIVTETNRAEASEAHLQSEIDAITGGAQKIKGGTGTTDGGGNATIVFGTPFPSACDSAVVCCGPTAVNCTIRTVTTSAGGLTCFMEDTNNSGGKSGPFFWIATGH